jgi:hypothetical protein
VESNLSTIVLWNLKSTSVDSSNISIMFQLTCTFRAASQTGTFPPFALCVRCLRWSFVGGRGEQSSLLASLINSLAHHLLLQ